jgi:hypothetical protein
MKVASCKNFAAGRCYMISAGYPMFSTTCPGVSYSGIKKPEAINQRGILAFRVSEN